MRNFAKLLLLLSIISFPFTGSYAKIIPNLGYEYDIEVDNIFYTVHDDGLYVSAQEAKVWRSYTGDPPVYEIVTSYHGEMDIPAEVEVENVVYKVIGVDQYAFYECDSLIGITFPESVIFFEDNCMKGCSQLKEVSISGPLSILPFAMFAGCSSLETIRLPGSVQAIGSYAFSGCSSIRNMVIPDNAESIGENAFSDCSSIRNMVIPDHVESIGEYAFYNCSALRDLVIGNSVSSIGKFAFSYCKSLGSIILPESVVFLGDDFVYGCSNLEEIVIPENVIIDNFMKLHLSGRGEDYHIDFHNLCEEKADKLRYFNYRNHFLMDGETRTYYRKGLNVMQYLPSEVREYASGSMSFTFAPDVDSIPKRFWQNNSLERMASITIPGTVRYIGESAFYGCHNLSLLTIEGNPDIEEYAFSGCDRIKRIVMGSDTPPVINNKWSILSNAEGEEWIPSLSKLARLEYTFPVEGSSGGHASYFSGKDGAYNWQLSFQLGYDLPGWYDVKVKAVPNKLYPEVENVENAEDVKPALLAVTVKYTDQDGVEQSYTRKDPSNSRKDFPFVLDGDSIMTLDAARLYFGEMKEYGERQIVTVEVKSALMNSIAHKYSHGAWIDCLSLELVSMTDPSCVEDVYSDPVPLAEEQILYDSIRNVYMSNLFPDNVYSDAELLVPEGTLDDYMNSGLWSPFRTLSEYDKTRLNVYKPDTPPRGPEAAHYGIDGRLVAPDVSGFHIIRSADGRVGKVLVK